MALDGMAYRARTPGKPGIDIEFESHIEVSGERSACHVGPSGRTKITC